MKLTTHRHLEVMNEWSYTPAPNVFFKGADRKFTFYILHSWKRLNLISPTITITFTVPFVSYGCESGF